MNKREVLNHIEALMDEAIAHNRLKYVIGSPRHTFRYEGTTMTVDTSFQSLDRLYRRVKRPNSWAKKRQGKALENAIDKWKDRNKGKL